MTLGVHWCLGSERGNVSGKVWYWEYIVKHGTASSVQHLGSVGPVELDILGMRQ